MAAVQIKNLDYSYYLGQREIPILKNFSLDIDPGDMVAIRGPSGSGKSTLLYLIGGFLKTNPGQIQVLGQDLQAMSEYHRALSRAANIGFVFQQFHLLSRASVLENVLLAAQYPAEQKIDPSKKKRAIELIERLGLSEQIHHKPNQLSGGQQQRVAIARALLNNPKILLADEPTGNLDSKTAHEILDLLQEINAAGTTVVIITHDKDVAERCKRQVFFKDGQVVEDQRLHNAIHNNSGRGERVQAPQENFLRDVMHVFFNTLSLMVRNIFRNKGQTALTMIGVIIGVASVVSMLTFGDFVQEQVLASYKTLGVNNVVLRGSTNRDAPASVRMESNFDEFDWQADILGLPRVFPEIRKMSPMLINWNEMAVSYMGKKHNKQVKTYGVASDFFQMTTIGFMMGRPLSPFDIDAATPSCVVGFSIVEKLFVQNPPLNEVLLFTPERMPPFNCRIVGVLDHYEDADSWNNPNLGVYLPFTFFQKVSPWWFNELERVSIQVADIENVEPFKDAIVEFFKNKYGAAGRFWAHSDAVMLNHIGQFVGMFKFLLGSIAFISLLVGGMGITNMMLASLSDQIKEIGIRKAHGATDFALRVQYISETTIICIIAGLLGLGLGIGSYHLVIYLAAQVVDKLQFEWVLNTFAVVLSLTAIIVTGILSGIYPALKASSLQVIDALRAE